MEENNLDPQTVFTIKHSELKGETQCKKHNWEILNNEEIICRQCMSAALVGKDNVYKYVSQQQ